MTTSTEQTIHFQTRQRLQELGLELPTAAASAASYVPATRVGSTVYTSGQLPLENGVLAAAGKVGTEVPVAEAAELAAQTPGLPEQAARDLDNIVKSALHSREVIKKLMIFGRKVPLQKMSVDLNRVIRDTLYFIEMSASRGRVEVRTELAEGLPPIMADPQHIKQVMVNLVVNAIHAMPGGGVLTIQTQSFKDDVYLSVGDTGVGLGSAAQRTQERKSHPPSHEKLLAVRAMFWTTRARAGRQRAHHRS